MQPIFFRGTADPFARELPVERSMDAVELLVENVLATDAVIRFRLRYKDLSATGDGIGYISLKTINNTYQITPRPLVSGSLQALTCPARGQFIVRVDFPHAFDIEEFSVAFKALDELDAFIVKELKYLSRKGDIRRFDLNGSDSGVGRLIARVTTTKDGAQPGETGGLATLLEGLQRYVDAGRRLPDFAELTGVLQSKLPLTTPASLLLPLLDGVPLRKQSEPVSNDVIDGIATIVLCVLRRDGWLSTTGLESFKGWLTDIPTIERFMERLNAIASAHPGMPSEFVISKHSINPAWLSIRRDNYLSCMRKVFEAMGEFGTDLVVCYGTLLGAVRDEKFIPHDDDIDLLYWDYSRSRQEALDRRDELAFRLKSKGFKVQSEPGLFHLNIGIDGGTCDLFPCWFEGDDAFLLMEKYQARNIPKSILLPSGAASIKLYGEKFPAPAKIEAFLEQRYGAGWKTPNKYFEWPWPLVED